MLDNAVAQLHVKLGERMALDFRCTTKRHVQSGSTDHELIHLRGRNMLEELMDDQEDIGDINLSSRPKREESRRQRDRCTIPTQFVCSPYGLLCTTSFSTVMCKELVSETYVYLRHHTFSSDWLTRAAYVSETPFPLHSRLDLQEVASSFLAHQSDLCFHWSGAYCMHEQHPNIPLILVHNLERQMAVSSAAKVSVNVFI